MRVLKALFIVIFIATVATASAVFYVKNAVTTPLSINEPRLYTVTKGSNGYKLIKAMRNDGMITVSPLVAKVWLKWFAGNTQVKSGTFMLLPTDSLVDVFTKFTKGEEHLFSVSLIEGLTLAQWLGVLESTAGIDYDLDATSIEAIVEGRSSSALQHIGLNDSLGDTPNYEGLFLADTYLFTQGTSASIILARAHDALIAFLNEQWETRQVELPISSAYDALILASIIEKETAVASERSLIAGVFANRLTKNMRLQTDPTVIYGIGPSYDGNITRKHLRTATPYNTYVIKGLPPTPIAMAGKAAINAALHPDDTDALYFVSKGDGTHKFSTTLEEHNAAVRKYQLKR